MTNLFTLKSIQGDQSVCINKVSHCTLPQLYYYYCWWWGEEGGDLGCLTMEFLFKLHLPLKIPLLLCQVLLNEIVLACDFIILHLQHSYNPFITK